MILKAYSVLDTKTGVHALPFFLHHDALAIRAIINVALEPASTLSQYPSDFVLLRIGEYDDNIGALFSSQPVNLGNVSTLLAGSSRAPTLEAAQ